MLLGFQVRMEADCKVKHEFRTKTFKYTSPEFNILLFVHGGCMFKLVS